MSVNQSTSWDIIAKKKRCQRESRIPIEWKLPVAIEQLAKTHSPQSLLRECGILSGSELIITDPDEHDATSLLGQLASSQITSRELTTIFCKRAAVAHQLTNCLTEILFEEAIARAEWLDKQLLVEGKPVGPLHGLPITFKDSFDILGCDTSIGISSLCFDPATRNSWMVELFTELGAIVIAKTTVPQTMLTADTDSIVFGRTVNAYNCNFGAGGSTGGEGALIALGGSPFGIGTDGAGSVRMPAAVNGVVGYKPSGYRLPLDGRPIMGPGIVGTTALGPVSVPGFLARSVRDVRLFTKLVALAEPWKRNPFVYPHPWQNVSAPLKDSIRIGIWASNGFLGLHPPIQRGFETSQRRLQAAGIELIDFKGPDISDVWELQKEWTEIQDLSYLRALLSEEPHTDIVKATAIINKEKESPLLTLEYLHSLNSRISRLVREMHEAWDQGGQPLDALLWVNAPHTAVPFDQYTYLGFTGLFNIIDWPAVALPLRMLSEKEIDLKYFSEPLNELDAKIQELYEPTSFDGLPLSVQLIGRRFQDERLLAISETVHKIIQAVA